MALKLLQPGVQPLGQFDGDDDQILTLKGGEVVTLVSKLLSTPDKAAHDSFDGYTNLAANAPRRPVVTRTLAADSRPLFLSDDGVSGYGTLFGTVVGGTVGQTAYGPLSTVPSTAQLGPHTATGSGKVTLWGAPGLYAVSLDACSQGTSGLQPTNTTLDTGDALTFTSTGLLTPVTGGGGVGSTPVATFVEFTNGGSLVTTPNNLVAGLATSTRRFAFATFWWNPPTA